MACGLHDRECWPVLRLEGIIQECFYCKTLPSSIQLNEAHETIMPSSFRWLLNGNENDRILGGTLEWDEGNVVPADVRTLRGRDMQDGHLSQNTKALYDSGSTAQMWISAISLYQISLVSILRNTGMDCMKYSGPRCE